MGKLLWTPSPERIEQSNVTRFTDFVNKRFGANVQDYWQLHRWSTEKIPDFWAALWEFTGIVSSHGYDTVVDDLSKFPGARWFPGAKLNFAENLLRYTDDRLAFAFKAETQRTVKLTYAELYQRVDGSRELAAGGGSCCG